MHRQGLGHGVEHSEDIAHKVWIQNVCFLLAFKKIEKIQLKSDCVKNPANCVNQVFRYTLSGSPLLWLWIFSDPDTLRQLGHQLTARNQEVPLNIFSIALIRSKIDPAWLVDRSPTNELDRDWLLDSTNRSSQH